MEKRFTLFLVLFSSHFIAPLYSQYFPVAKVMDKQPVNHGPEYKMMNEQNGSQLNDYHQRYFFMCSEHLTNKFGDNQRIKYQYWNDTDWVQLKELKTSGYNYGLIFWGDRILAEGWYFTDLQDKPMHKMYNLLEYKNDEWDTLPGALGATYHYKYYSTDKDLFRLIATSGNSELYKYNIQKKKFEYLAKIEFNSVYDKYLVGGKNRMLIPLAKSINDKPCHGFAYYENDSLYLNGDSTFNDSFFYTIDRVDDRIYGYNFRNNIDIIEFTNQFAGRRKTTGLFSDGIGNIGFGVDEGLMYIDFMGFTSPQRTVNVLAPGSTKWEQVFGPTVMNSLNGWAIKNNCATGGYYLYDQDARKTLHVEKGSRIYGKASIDIDSNCIWSAGNDVPMNRKLIVAKSTLYTTAAFTDANGNYELFVAPGTYALSGPIASLCPGDVNVTKISQELNKDLHFKAPTLIDLSVGWLNAESQRWFDPAKFKFVIDNLGRKTDTVYFEIKLKPGFNITSAMAPVSTFSGNTAKGKIASINDLDQIEIKLTADIDTMLIKSNLEVCHTFSAFAIGRDKDSSNNKKDLCMWIVNSYDPNHKTSNRQNILRDSKTGFDYTIEFQNEGTSYAAEVILEDHLDKAFDINTFRFLGASHACTYTINSNFLRVTFNNINLVAKATNEEASKGFFKYSLSTDQKLNTDTVILNTASIIFDRNFPIVTNTVNTTVRVDQSSVKDILSLKKGFEIYPNPVFGILHISNCRDMVRVYNLQGGLIASGMAIDGKCSISTAGWPSGIYAVENAGFWQKLIKN